MMKKNQLFLLLILILFPAMSIGAELRTLEIDFSFTAPEDPARQLLGYRLYKEGEQVCETTNPSSSSVTCELLTEDGTFDFTLSAYYSNSTESPQSPSFPLTIVSVTPPNSVPLQAVITPTQTTGSVPLNVSFVAADSTGDISTYSWDFGDGTSSTGPSTSHTYTVSGTYTAILNVVDQAGATHQATTVITAQPNTAPPVPPTAVVSSSTAAGNAPLKVTFNGTSSTTTDSSLVSYNWTFGDGSQATGETTSHTFTTAGTYYTKLTVVDSNGLSDSVNTPIVVIGTAPANEIPNASISTSQLQGDSTLIVSFDASQSSDPDGTLVSYNWNFGDGTTGSGQSVQHTYTSAATYSVSLQVTDDKGATASATCEVVCNSTLPDEDLNIEIGTVSIDHNWVKVFFENVFNQPVVVAGPPTMEDGQPALVRIRNIDQEGFEIRIQEWDYLDDWHAVETVSYIVVEEGTYTLDNGIMIEAGSFTGSMSLQQVSLQQTYNATPVILTQVTTENEFDAVTNRVRDIDLISFKHRLREQEKNKKDHSTETIGYIAWEPGQGEVSGLLYEAGTTGRSVKHDWFDITFQTEFPDLPFFFAGMQTTYGKDSAAVRTQNMSQTTTQIKIDEEQSRDSEIIHKTEVIGYLSIGAAIGETAN